MDEFKGYDPDQVVDEWIAPQFPDWSPKRYFRIRLDRHRKIQVSHDLPVCLACLQGEIGGLAPGESRLVVPGEEWIGTNFPVGVLVHLILVEFYYVYSPLT